MICPRNSHSGEAPCAGTLYVLDVMHTYVCESRACLWLRRTVVLGPSLCNAPSNHPVQYINTPVAVCGRRAVSLRDAANLCTAKSSEKPAEFQQHLAQCRVPRGKVRLYQDPEQILHFCDCLHSVLGPPPEPSHFPLYFSMHSPQRAAGSLNSGGSSRCCQKRLFSRSLDSSLQQKKER